MAKAKDGNGAAARKVARKAAGEAAARAGAARERLERLEQAGVESLRAREELRAHAAAWLAAIRSRLTALYAEVTDVQHASKPGEVLHGLLDGSRLNALAVGLSEAAAAAGSMHVPGYDVPIPALLAVRDHVCDVLFPLAEEGARVGHDGPGAEGGT